MEKIQEVIAVRHSLKDAEKNISPEGEKLAEERIPMIIGPFFSHPTYVGPLPRCTQTAKAMGIGAVIEEDLFHIPDSAMSVINNHMDWIKAFAKKQGCTGVAAILEMSFIPAISKMLMNLKQRVQEGIVKVCQENPDSDQILVISHSPVIDAAVEGYATGGLNEMDFVKFYVQRNKIIHSIVCRHVAVT